MNNSSSKFELLNVWNIVLKLTVVSIGPAHFMVCDVVMVNLGLIIVLYILKDEK